VRDTVALGEDDAVLGQRIVLVVTPMTSQLEVAVLAAALKQILPHYMVPSRIDVRDELPRSPNGKYDRNLLTSEVLE
jgi:acyl-CoA synthetase (AMP-forming)/AMP-acid ligase II